MRLPLNNTIAVALIFTFACGDNNEPENPLAQTIGDHVRTDPRFTTLESVFEQTGILDSLDEPGPTTLLAPTDAAFDALLAERGLTLEQLLELSELADLAEYHLHPGELSTTELERRTAITTRFGTEIHVRFGRGGLLLDDGVLVTDVSIEADNGVIHILDAVLPRPLDTRTTTIEGSSGLALNDSTEEGIGLTTDTITIDDAGFVHAVQIVLDISHPRVFDLSIFLQNVEAGISIPLVNAPRSLLSDVTATLADSSSLDVIADVSFDDPDGLAFPAAAYRPLEPLELLVGAEVAGDWRLMIMDRLDGEVGRLRSWSMLVTFGDEAPAEAIVFTRDTGGSSVLPRGFVEPIQVAVARVGGLVGDVELGATAGDLTAPPQTLADEINRGTVEIRVASDSTVGPRDLRVSADAGDTSRFRTLSSNVVEPDRAGLELLANISLAELGAGGTQGNDVWGWVDPMTDVEYALMGTEVGTTFVDLSTPETPVVVGILPTRTDSALWRDIKVFADHAFIVSEATDHGLQVFDLSQLRGVTSPQTFSSVAVNLDFGNAHNIAINEDTGFAYIVGATEDAPMICAGGLLMIDINVPTSPTSVGCFAGGVPAGQQPGPDFPTDAYIHDVQCVSYAGPDPDYQGREICISSDGQIANDNNYLAIADVTDKASPVQVSRKSYVGAGYAHQGWLTEDHRYFLLNDEFDEFQEESNTRTYVWDVSDLDNPTVIGSIVNPRDAIGHNTYVKGNLAYQANYTSGLRIVDLTDVANGT